MHVMRLSNASALILTIPFLSGEVAHSLFLMYVQMILSYGALCNQRASLCITTILRVSPPLVIKFAKLYILS